jgi:hypothetical protein
MGIAIGVVALGLFFVGFKLVGSSETPATPATAAQPQPAANANVIVPMTAKDIQKNLPPVQPIKAPTPGLTKQFKLTPEMIQAQQKAYRERFGKSY